MALASGIRLGPYEIVSPLGAGGMGEVYRARDTRLGRDVAIKVLPAGVARDLDRRARFEREAHAVAALSHPNILAIHDIGSEGDHLYVVTELLDGETLADRLTHGALPVRKSIEIAVAIARGLSAAHGKGIAHRDLKPANIFLLADGQVKILDFGLARDISAASGATETRAALTDPGTVLGTAGYMAPEQIRGQAVDGRADLFALGAVFYEMLTGRRAFARETTAETMTAVLREDPPGLADTRVNLPPALDRIVHHCLEKNPTERFQTARDVVFALETLSSTASGPNVAASSKPSRRWSLGLVAAVALIAAGGSWWASGRLRPAAPPPNRVQFTVAMPPGMQIPDYASPVVAPDGLAIAFHATGVGKDQQIWIHTLADGQTKAIAGTEGAWRQAWSPDGQYLAFFGSDSIKKVRAAGGSIETVCANLTFADEGSALTWVGNDKIVFSQNSVGGLWQVSANGGAAQQLTRLDREHGETGHLWPYGLSDNRFIFSVSRTGSIEKTVMIGSIDEATSRRVIDVSGNATTPDGASLLFTRGRTVVLQRFERDSARLVGEPSLITDGLSVANARAFDAKGGTLAYLSSNRQASLAWVDRAGRQVSAVDVDGTPNWPSLAPDGHSIAVDIENPKSGVKEIWVIDGTRRSRLTFGPEHDSDVVWAPDGKRLAFGGNDGGELSELTIGENTIRRLRQFGGGSNHTYPTDWSRDGRWIAYAGWDTGRPDIFLFPTSGDPTPLQFTATPFHDHQARFSPDSRYVAYAADDTGRPEVYIQAMPPAKGRWLVSTNGGAQPMWRGDGKELYYLTLDNVLTAVPVTLSPTPGFGAPVSLFKVQLNESVFYSVRNHYSVSPDGRRFLVNSVTGRSNLNVVLNWTAALADEGAKP